MAEFVDSIIVPEGVDVNVNGDAIVVKGQRGEITRSFKHPNISFSVGGGRLEVKYSARKLVRGAKMHVCTYSSLIRSMIKGVKEGYVAVLKVCSGHFPMSVSVAGSEFVVKNYFGEKVPRKLKLMSGVEVKVNGDMIEVRGIDKEKVGQMAAKIEQIATVTNKDRRIFQDGCYIVRKPE